MSILVDAETLGTFSQLVGDQQASGGTLETQIDRQVLPAPM